jgi:hypothetical protein
VLPEFKASGDFQVVKQMLRLEEAAGAFQLPAVDSGWAASLRTTMELPPLDEQYGIVERLNSA